MQAEERLKPYWCFVCVRLKNPIVYIDIDNRDSVQATGYWMRLGVTAPSRLSLRHVIRRVIKDGFVQWQQSTFEPIQSQDLDQSVSQESHEMNLKGVWYTGGRAYFVD